MRVIGKGAPVAIYLTTAEFDQLRANVAQGNRTPPPTPIVVPDGIPIYASRYLTESVVMCESEAPRAPWFEWRPCRQ